MLKNKVIITVLSILMILNCYIVYAVPPEPPGGIQGEKPQGEPPANGEKPGENSNSISYSGATTISEDYSSSNETYASTSDMQNSLLVNGGTSSISDAVVTKSGNAEGDEADFYGTNAAILAYNGATLNIEGGRIETNGSHANAVFAYKDGTINISKATIETISNNSGAIMVTGGGILNANDVTATTNGNSSAPIRSDRGGGTINVNGGAFTSNGIGSPVIYSTANIIVNDSVLTSTSSEGVVVEGSNSVALNNSKLTDTNTSLNGNSETYKNIFLYQSMSGDAEVGNSLFTAKDSTIITNNGDTIFVTNTTSTITLENNKILNTDENGGFIRIQKGKWGQEGANGGNVTLNLINQDIEGNVFVDEISELKMVLQESSKYKGEINSENKAKNIVVSLDGSSILTLTGDSYISELNNELEDNSNINLNGYTLYVNGKAITSTNYKETGENNNQEGILEVAEGLSNKTGLDLTIIYIIAGLVVAFVIVIIVIAIKRAKKNKTK